MGVFSVAPCTGSLHPGALQVVTVTCAAEQLGIWKQGLLIDVSDRDPSDHPNGIPYTLLSEVCRPSKCLISFTNQTICMDSCGTKDTLQLLIKQNKKHVHTVVFMCCDTRLEQNKHVILWQLQGMRLSCVEDGSKIKTWHYGASTRSDSSAIVQHYRLV